MSLDQIVLLLEQSKYLLLFPLAVIEGPIVTVIAGFMVAGGLLNPLFTYVVVVVADVVGDAFWYLLGRYGGGPLTRLAKKLFGIHSDNVDRMRKEIELHRFKAMALSKFTWGVGAAGLMAAGTVRVSYFVFATTCLIFSAAQALVFLTIGYFFGEAFNRIATYQDYIGFASLFVGAGLALYLFFYYRYKTKPKP